MSCEMMIFVSSKVRTKTERIRIDSIRFHVFVLFLFFSMFFTVFHKSFKVPVDSASQRMVLDAPKDLVLDPVVGAKCIGWDI